jgi:hypothetical protein
MWFGRQLLRMRKRTRAILSASGITYLSSMNDVANFTGEMEALSFCQETIELKKQIEAKFLELGKRLQIIKENKLYEPQWENWTSYCWELDMSPSKASRLVGVYETFVTEHGISEDVLTEAGGWSNLAEIKDVADSKESAQQWIEKAKQLSRPDLRTEVKVAKGNDDPAECIHEDTYTLRVCRDCGQRVRVHGE